MTTYVPSRRQPRAAPGADRKLRHPPSPSRLGSRLSARSRLPSVGVTDAATHNPSRNGVVPHRGSPAASRSRRSVSHAHTSAAARWNCWAVSNRSVYRISTATPRVPSRSASPEPITPCKRRIANHTPPVRDTPRSPATSREESSCTWASEGSTKPLRASACEGSVSPGRHSSTNANSERPPSTYSPYLFLTQQGD